MKKLLIFAILFITLMFVGRMTLTHFMAPRIFERAVSGVIGADQMAKLEDGLHIYICGAGSPLPDRKRSGACIGVVAGDKAFVIDVGSGSFRNLGLMEFPISHIDQFYLTHIHSDHFDGLGEALLLTWIASGRDSPVSVAGPTGTVNVVEGLRMAYADDSRFRIAHHGEEVADPEGFGGIGTDIDLRDGILVIYEDDVLKITAATVSHDPVDPAYGYRIDYKDRSVFISGDSAYDPNIADYAKDVDVLFHDALNHQMVGIMRDIAKEKGAISQAKIFGDILDYHASPVEAAQTALEANAEHLVIYHSIPPIPVDMLKPIWAKGMDKVYKGKITISEDGTIVRLPAGKNTIIYQHGL